MKLLAKIEKQKIAWVLILLCVVFFFLRLPSIIEPYWYGDEGIYEVIGQSMDHGRLLYRDIWDNKPPLLYVIYAFANGDQASVKTFSLLVGILTIITFYFLSQKLFAKQKIRIILTALFALLFATPLLEANIANAEDFILLPVILAGLLIFTYSSKQNFPLASYKQVTPKKLFLAGLLLGLAFLLKIVAVFDLTAFILFLIILKLPERQKFAFLNLKLWTKTLLPNTYFIILGFVLPFILTTLYFAFHFAVKDFFQSVFLGNVDYVAWKNSLFGIPQGWLVLKIVLLVTGIGLLVKNRNRLSKAELFILLWLFFSLFNTYFSGRPYTHYAIVFLPSFCLFIGLLFNNYPSVTKTKIFAAIVILVIALTYQFRFNLTGSITYYQNVMQFLSGKKNVEAYQSYFDQKVPRDYIVANFISRHTTANEPVFVWGNNPEVYALSHKIPIGKYTVTYHITQNNAFDETQEAINKKSPKYIIVLNESGPLPFAIPLYIMRYNLTGATIYERSL